MGAVVLADFLSRHPRYEVFAMRYGDGFNHVYGVRGSVQEVKAIVDVLRFSRPYDHETSYARVRGIDSGIVCRFGAWLTPQLPKDADLCRIQ